MVSPEEQPLLTWMLPPAIWNTFVYQERKASRIVGGLFSTLIAFAIVMNTSDTTDDLKTLIAIGVISWAVCASFIYLLNHSSQNQRYTRYNFSPVPIAIFDRNAIINNRNICFDNDRFRFFNARAHEQGKYYRLYILYGERSVARRQTTHTLTIPYLPQQHTRVQQLVNYLNRQRGLVS